MIPATLRAGDTWTITVPESASYPSADYAPHLFLRGPEAKTLDGAAGSLDITQTAAQTKNFTPGVYQFALYWTKDTERYTTVEGNLEVLPNPELLQGAIDGRSHAQKMVDLIQTQIEQLAVGAAKQVTLGGHSYTKEDMPVLHGMRRKYINEVEVEQRKQRGKKMPTLKYGFQTPR